MAPVWQARLIRFFGDEAKLHAALDGMAGGASETVPFAGMARDEIAARIEAEMEAGGFTGIGGRTADEIADRIVEKHMLAGTGLGDAARAALADFLAIETPLSAAGDALDRFAATHGVDLAQARIAFAARIAAFAKAGIAIEPITFRAAFGRPLDYYSAMQFEIVAGASPEPLVGGGRYDRLLTLLGAPLIATGLFSSSRVPAVETTTRIAGISAGVLGGSPGEVAKVDNQITDALKSVFAVAESYPDLKANQNFLQLQDELVDTEDKIQAARRFYNGAVRELNTKVQMFPTNVFANMLGFKKREFFEVENQAEVEKPVDVDL